MTPDNPLGWPGLWPTLQPYASWDPSIHATNASTGCSISSDDDPGASGSLACDDYECDYTTLHLPNRAAQVKSMTIDPGSSGWAGWKEALWTLNYLQVMHDSTEAAVNTVPGRRSSRSSARAGNTDRRRGRHGRRRPRRARSSVRATSRASRRATSSRSSTTRARSGWRSSRRPTARRSAASRA